MAKSKHTQDYDQFHFLNYNRDIDLNLVKRLKFSIEKNNLLEYRPILVNQNLEIIDGQHRLLAAKALNVPVWYEIQENGHEEDLIILNAIGKQWDSEDYLNYYCKKHKVAYLLLERLMKEYEISISVLLRLAYGKSHSLTRNFKEGTLAPLDEGKLKEMMGYTDLVNSLLKTKMPWDAQRYLKSRTFLRAITLFLSHEQVSVETFLTKLNMQIQSIHPCISLKDYIIMFQNIYNWKNRDPIGTDIKEYL